MKKLIFLALACLLAATPLAAGRFFLKALGGFGYFPWGDYNSGIQGMTDWARDLYANVSGTLDCLDRGWEAEFGGELELNPSLG